MISTRKARKLRNAIRFAQSLARMGSPTLRVIELSKSYKLNRRVMLHAYYAAR